MKLELTVVKLHTVYVPSCRESTFDHKVKQEEPPEKVNHTKAAGS